jgi:hypothetical protein
MAIPRLYCIDTSSVVALKRSYPRKALRPLWDLLEQIADEGRLIAPREVLRELDRVDDEMKAWAKAHSGIFVPIDAEQGNVLTEIQTEFPEVGAATKQGPHADPWCLALSLMRMRSGEDIYLLNEEKDTVTRSVKIPYIARYFKIQWARVLDVPSLEGLEFYLK